MKRLNAPDGLDVWALFPHYSGNPVLNMVTQGPDYRCLIGAFQAVLTVIRKNKSGGLNLGEFKDS